jgi:hypothetical protein
MSQNAHRRAGGGNLTQGYMKMQKDRTVFQHWTGTKVHQQAVRVCCEPISSRGTDTMCTSILCVWWHELGALTCV